MIHFKSLVFVPTLIEGNTMATVMLDNGYQFDVIRNLTKRTYKVKGFELGEQTKGNVTKGQKKYVHGYFEGYLTHPEFGTKDEMLTFVNEIEQLPEDE